jgi:hypothetical protein
MRSQWMIGVVFGLFCSVPVFGQSLSSISNRDATQGLKDALVQGAGKAVSQLSAANGFLGNKDVRIPLPSALGKIEKGMRLIGQGQQADELVTNMNRAAELAVKEAAPLLVDAVKQMSVEDAKGILTGGDDSATRFFERKTSEPLALRFLPIVKQVTAKLQLAQQYNQLAAQGARFGVIRKENADLDGYVTQKALDGLFFVIAEQERTIRKNPGAAASGVAQKVFGALER